MNRHWFVVKHIPDLVRGEPRNIGVIAFAGDSVLSRYVGEAPDTNEIDGRTVSHIGHHLVYKAWVRQWRELSEQGLDAVRDAAGNGRRAGDNFYIAEGGEETVGHDPRPLDEYLGDLYAALVRLDHAPPVADDVRSLSRGVFRRLGVLKKVRERERVSLPTGADGVPDDLWFDYRYDNGRPHLMQRVGLGAADKGTWDRLHLVETTFERLQAMPGYEDASTVALVKTQDADDRLVKAVQGRLATFARLIDVGDQEQAARDLAEVFHL